MAENNQNPRHLRNQNLLKQFENSAHSYRINEDDETKLKWEIISNQLQMCGNECLVIW